MRPGDVICNKKHQYDEHWWEANCEELLVLDEEPTVRGCIMVRGQDGKTRCVNPRYFKVVKTREERVAEEMMRPDTVEYRRVHHEDIMNQIHTAASRAIAGDLDKAILGTLLPLCSKEEAKKIGDLIGWKWKEESDGKE